MGANVLKLTRKVHYPIVIFTEMEYLRYQWCNWKEYLCTSHHLYWRHLWMHNWYTPCVNVLVWIDYTGFSVCNKRSDRAVSRSTWLWVPQATEFCLWATGKSYLFHVSKLKQSPRISWLGTFVLVIIFLRPQHCLKFETQHASCISQNCVRLT